MSSKSYEANLELAIISHYLCVLHPSRSRSELKVSIEGPVTLPSTLCEFDYTHVSSVQSLSYVFNHMYLFLGVVLQLIIQT